MQRFQDPELWAGQSVPGNGGGQGTRYSEITAGQRDPDEERALLVLSSIASGGRIDVSLVRVLGVRHLRSSSY